jgi:hypothetical protein
MLSGKRAKRTFLIGLITALALVGGGISASNTALASNPNPTVLPPHAIPYGMSYGDWGAQWWIWATERPTETSPLFGSGQVDCAVGQSGPVWFLAGGWGGGQYERTCSIPPGKAIFLPLVNGLSFAPEFGETEEEIREDVADDLEGIDSVGASVDGVPLQGLFGHYRKASSAFTFPIPEGGLLAEWGLDTGDRFPAVSDGWWLMLAPLPVGEHTIEFGGEGTDFDLSVTYHLTVGP